MNSTEFAIKWAPVKLRERAGAQEHFLDLCRMLGVQTPAEVNPNGEWFTFEKGLDKSTGGRGFADVWRKDHFAWEYKGRKKDLAAAYQQLQLYREALGNPPLLVVCDLDTFQVHTNFNNTVKRVYEFDNGDLAINRPVGDSDLTPTQILSALFDDPQKLNPGKLQSRLTEEAADLLRVLADDMREWKISERDIARFIMRMIFCFFASDVGLLPKVALTDLIEINKSKPADFRMYLSELFAAMKDSGGKFLMRDIPHFNGELFDDTYVPPLIADHIALLEQLQDLDWSDIEPSIFGTLFERIIDKRKRKQLGTHYTSREDIELIVEPVLMRPMRQAWEREKKRAKAYIDWHIHPENERSSSEEKLREILSRFIDRLASWRVLDPACGSGNFLYVSLALLKALEKEVIVFGAQHGISGLAPKVHPRQLFGIEINEYANELASTVVWIGYLQWKFRNALDLADETPIIEPLQNIARIDAIVARDENGKPTEPEWQDAEVILGNPPFLGGKILRRELGDDYVDALFEMWSDRVPREADLCCYWFEKARAQIESGRTKRAGLLATQGIRGGKNRTVLDRITETGGIFWAQSDREWTLDGASVRISMVGFDNRREKTSELDGMEVPTIYANLRSGRTDVTKALRLKENLGIAFMGITKGGSFDIAEDHAKHLLEHPNPDGRPNSDVVRPWIIGADITGRPRSKWIIDFPPEMPIDEAALYEGPFEYVKKTIKPERDTSRTTTSKWWIHERPRIEMRAAFHGLERYIGTSQVSKHRAFTWIPTTTLPSSSVIVFARDDDYFFGILHSRIHRLWAVQTGTQLGAGPRYTPTSTFETFPLACATPDQEANISNAAKHLSEIREGWLKPPVETDSFPESKERTLNNLYNAPPSWLTVAHEKLDEAVFAAYGWPPNLSDGEIVARLLELNLLREPA